MADLETSWDLIDRCAAELGILAETRRKWRERHGVPHKWRVPLLQQFARHGRAAGLDFFDNLGPPPNPSETPETEAAE